MIVVDSNVIAYCWLNTPQTSVAQAVRVLDDDWHVPVLWRSELRSVLAGYLRRGDMTLVQVSHVMARMEAELEGQEHLVESGDVLALAKGTSLSAYDCEFAALAEALDVPLVTEDRALLKALPNRAKTMEMFLQ